MTPDDVFAKQIEGGTVFKADTVEELAGKLGFEGESKENFLAQVERCNELCDQQSDDDFGKEAFRLSALCTPPFYGGWFGACYLTAVAAPATARAVCSPHERAVGKRWFAYIDAPRHPPSPSEAGAALFARANFPRNLE